MTEIEPTIENVRVGDVVTIEAGKPGEPGHTLDVYRVDGAPISTWGIALTTVFGRVRGGYYRLTRITRPDLPIPFEPGERFWARWDSGHVEEYVVTDGENAVHLESGTLVRRWDFPYPVVPAPEPETVSVPADLVREAVEWRTELSDAAGRSSWAILRDIVQAVREARKEAGDE